MQNVGMSDLVYNVIVQFPLHLSVTCHSQLCVH